MLTPAERRRLSRAALSWLLRQRRRHRPRARPLTAPERAAYAGWFAPELLERVRLRVVERVPAPRLPAEARRAGLDRLLDFRQLEGLALVDTILLTRQAMPAAAEVPVLIFHELVHTAQYARLGTARFVASYLAGWLRRGDGEAIPLEREARRLEDLFRQGASPRLVAGGPA